MSPVPHLSFAVALDTHTLAPRVLGFSLPAPPDLSKHAGFQTIQSRAKETCQSGPGVMLSQQWMTDLKGKRGFVGNLHGRTSSHFGVVCCAAGSCSFWLWPDHRISVWWPPFTRALSRLHYHGTHQVGKLGDNFCSWNEIKKGKSQIIRQGREKKGKSWHAICSSCVLHGLKAQISAQLENNGRSPPSCRSCILCQFEWQWYRDLQWVFKQQQFTVENTFSSYCKAIHTCSATRTHVHTRIGLNFYSLKIGWLITFRGIAEGIEKTLKLWIVWRDEGSEMYFGPVASAAVECAGMF